MLSIGLMSGTSMDGVDVALLKTDGLALIEERGHFSLSYPHEFKQILKLAEKGIRLSQGDLSAAARLFSELLAQSTLRNSQVTLDEVIQRSTEYHLEAVQNLLKKYQLTATEIDVAGYHGQTFFHQPEKRISVILGNAQYLADQCGISVVSDFRRQDIEHGGQGAPFAPLYHQALAIRDQKIPLAVLNCGGIANITLIKNDNPLDLIAFDTGPGNGLIDRFVRERTNDAEHMDLDGRYGQKGKVHAEVLEILVDKAVTKASQNYFKLPIPKSLDIGDLTLITELGTLSLEDGCATLEAFTAETIVRSVEGMKDLPPQWILAGGGWNNPVIVRELQQRLQQRNLPITLQKADDAGWNGQALEAQIFAYLAVRSLKGLPLSFPGTTGVTKPMTGGKTCCPV